MCSWVDTLLIVSPQLRSWTFIYEYRVNYPLVLRRLTDFTVYEGWHPTTEALQVGESDPIIQSPKEKRLVLVVCLHVCLPFTCIKYYCFVKGACSGIFGKLIFLTLVDMVTFPTNISSMVIKIASMYLIWKQFEKTMFTSFVL